MSKEKEEEELLQELVRHEHEDCDCNEDPLEEIREALERHEAASMYPNGRSQADIDAECVKDVQEALNWTIDPSLVIVT